MTLWVPGPNDVISGPAQRATGTGNMGDVTDRASTARFYLTTERYVLCWVRLLFSGGTGDATVTLKVDHRDEIGFYDFPLRDWEDMGADNVSWKYERVTADELFLWTFQKGDVLVFEWANPDTVNMRWSIEVGLADAKNQ